MKIFLSGILIVASVLVGCRSEQQTSSTGAQQPETGSTPEAPGAGSDGRVVLGGIMPDYEAIMLDGSPFRMGGAGDKVVLLNIWATWCGPCRIEIPELEALHTKLAPQGFEVVGVSIDDPGATEIVREFVGEQHMTYPVVLDPQGRIADMFQTTVIPTSALIDRSGKILWMHRGLVRATDPALNAALEEAL